MIEGRGEQQGDEHRAFPIIDGIASKIHERGGSSIMRTGEYTVPLVENGRPAEMLVFVKSSDLPENPERSLISRSTRGTKVRVSDDLSVDHDGTFRYRDSAPGIDAVRKLGEDADPVQRKALSDEIVGDHGMQYQLGLDTATDRKVHQYLSETKKALGTEWPEDVALPDNSAGDVIPSPSTHDLFGSVVDRLAVDKEMKLQRWSDEEQTYILTTEKEADTVQRHILQSQEDQGEDNGIPILRTREWTFPRTTEPLYVTISRVDYDNVDYETLDPSAQQTYDQKDQETYDTLEALDEAGAMGARPEHIALAETILQRRGDALSAENEN